MYEDRVRIPRQKRSIENKQKIKKTAQELFSEQGYYNTSSNDIVRAAGVSIGAFYSYFKDKKGLFIEILHEYNQNVIAQLPAEVIVNDNLRTIIEEYILAVLHAHSYSPEFHREILAMTYADKEIKEIIDHYENSMIGQVAQLLEKNRKLTRITEPTQAAFLIFKSVEEVVHSIKVFARPCDEAALLRELTDMLLAYLAKR